VQLDVPVREHRLYVYHQPQLYELARLTDAYPRYAAVVVDSERARIFVFALGATLDHEEIEGPTTNRTEVGGWSQARFQRHVDHLRQQHAKEVVAELDRIVRADDIGHVVLAGDAVIIPVVRAELPPHLADKVIDVVRLDITTPEHEILEATLRSMQAQDAREDADRVRRAIDGYRAGGLGVAGIGPTLVALTRGQVDELLISAEFASRHAEPVPRDSPLVPPELALELADEVTTVDLADELVSRARSTGATVSFIENPALLAEVDGVAGLLRFTL
jgi:peptide chain release factor subunit 1